LEIHECDASMVDASSQILQDDLTQSQNSTLCEPVTVTIHPTDITDGIQYVAYSTPTTSLTTPTPKQGSRKRISTNEHDTNVTKKICN
jgi:hypothetical protein